MHCITPKQFLQTLFPEDLMLPDEAPVVAHPASFTSTKTGEQVDYYRQFHWHPRSRLPNSLATYFCLSTIERQRARQVKKRLEDVRTAMVLAVDDVGTKSVAPDVPASYTLETSPGNFQLGWLLEPYDVSSPAGQAYYDSCLYSLAQAGMNDDGFRSASRLARLPGSMHKTGFRARVVDWSPSRVWELTELMTLFDIPLKQPRKTYAVRPGKYTRLSEVEDPVYAWLVDNWPVLGHNDQWVHIECPWRERHTGEGQGASSTAYSPRDYGRAGVGFKCLHGHCAGRGLDDFLTFIHSEINR